MSIQVADLVAVLRLDGADYQQNLDQAQNGFTRLGQSAQSANTQAARSFTQTSAEAKKLGDAVVAAAEKGVRAQNRMLDSTESVRRAEVDLGRARNSGDAEKALRAEANLERARRAHETATRAAERAEAEGVNRINEFTRAAERARRAQEQFSQETENAARAHQRLGDQVSSTNPFSRLRQSASEAGQEAGEGLAGAIPGPLAAAARAGGPIGMAVMAIAAVGIIAGKALADNIMQGLEIQAGKGRDKAKFGWSEQQAAEAGKAAADAYGNAWGESSAVNRQAAGIAIQSGLLDGDATAAEIQPVIEKLNILKETMGTDIPETARAAGQMVRTGLVKDSAEALDLLAAAQQGGLNVSEDLLDTMTEYGTQFRKLGLDGPTALGLVSQMWKAGARDTDVAADALKEFSIRVVDGSKETTGAFEQLGYNADDIAARFAKGGQSARDAFSEVVTKIQGVRDPLVRAGIETALFGTQAEDLGAALNGINMTTAPTTLGEIAGAAGRMGEQMGGAAADIQAAKNKIENAANGVREKLAEAFAPKIGEAANWVSEHTEEITRGFEILGGVLVATAGAVGTVGGAVVGVVGDIIEHTAKLLRLAFTPLMAGMEWVGKMMGKIPGPAGEVGRSISAAAASGRASINDWIAVGEGMSDFGYGAMRASYQVGEAGGALARGEERAKSATEAFGGLGIKVREVPESKQIVIEDNSPETQQKLKDLGIKVQTLPDGTLYINADDKDAADKIRELTKPAVKQIIIKTQDTTTSWDNGSVSITPNNPGPDRTVNDIRKMNGLKPIAGGDTKPGQGVGINGTAIPVKPGATKAGAALPPADVPETVVQQTTDEKKKAAKLDAAKEKRDAAATKKEEADQKKAAADRDKLEKAQAGIAAKERAVAMAEQRIQELKPNASASSRMSAQNSLISAKEALEKAQASVADLSAKVAGQPAPTATSTGEKPVTVTGDGKGGTVNVGTDGKPLQVEPSNTAQGDGLRVFVTNMPAGGIGGGGVKLSLFSGGGNVTGAGTGTSDSIPAMLSNGEYVVKAAQAARFGGLLAAINSGRVQKFADGGPVSYGLPVGTQISYGQSDKFPEWVRAIEQQFGVKASTYAGHQEKDGQNKGIDWSGPVDAMQRFAEYAATAGLEQVIWQNPTTGQRIGVADGKPVGPGTDQPQYYSADWSGHTDHVHTRQSYAFGPGAGTGATGGSTQAPEGSREWLAAKLLEAGLSPDQVRGVLAMNKVEGGEDDPKSILGFTEAQAISLGGQGGPQGHLNAFLKEQWNDKSRRNADGSIPGVDTSGNVTDETAYLDWIQKKIVGQTGVTSDWQGNQQPAASDYAGRLASAYAGIAAPTVGGTGSTDSTTGSDTGSSSTPGSSGGTQNVFVTNWPTNLGGGMKFSLFNTGGPVTGPGTATSDSIPALLSNGEYVVRAQAARANYGLLETINRAGTPLKLAGGGPVIAPKIEAPKIAPQIGGGISLGPAGGIPIPGVGTPAPSVGMDPLAALKGGTQQGVPGTFNGQEYAVQRLIQYGGDMAKVGVQALKEIALPSGLDSQQAQNVMGLIKGVGSGLSASKEKAESSSTSKSADGKTTTITNNHTWNVSSPDEAYRNLKRDEGRKALTYDGSLP